MIVWARRHDDRRKREALGSLERFAGLASSVGRSYGERDEAIRAAFDAGAGVSEIAHRLAVSRSSVYLALHSSPPQT